jgi:hypothetical protein
VLALATQLTPLVVHVLEASPVCCGMTVIAFSDWFAIKAVEGAT